MIKTGDKTRHLLYAAAILFFTGWGIRVVFKSIEFLDKWIR
jgi:hypothetical protein